MQKLNLSYKNNDDLKAALEGKKPGDECSMTIKVVVETNDDSGFSGKITGVELEDDYSEKEEEIVEEAPEMEDETPILVVMKGKPDAGEAD